jgi:hypothetical protein
VTRCAWLAAALFVLSWAQASLGMEPHVRDVLSDKRFRFCHEAKYPLFEEERAWCPLVGDKSEVCPELPAACLAELDPEHERAAPSPQEKRSAPSEDDERRAAEKRESARLPSGLSAIAQVLFWALIVAGVLGLIWVIIKNYVKGEPPADAEDQPPLDEGETPPPLASRIVETDVQRLLARAREAASRGDYQGAIDAAYAAVLRRLEGDGLIDMHASRTNGDYVRALRDRPELYGELRAIVGEVERTQFGATAPSAPLFDAVMARVVPVATRAATLLLVLLMLVTGCGPRGEASTAPQSRGGSSPSGTRAIIEVLKAGGVDAGYRLKPFDHIEEDVGVIVVLRGGGPDNWRPLFEWVDAGGILVLAGELPPNDVMALEAVVDESKNPVFVPGGIYYYRLQMREARVPPMWGLRVPSDAYNIDPVLSHDPSVREGPHYAVHQLRKAGELIVFADDQLFSNIALTTDHNAEILVMLLEGRGKVEFADPWSSKGADNPLDSMHQAHLTPLIVQLLVLLLLFVLWKGIAFGAPRDPEQRTRRSFAEHVRALGMQYARARAGGHAFGSYAGWALERLRDRMPRGRQLSTDALAYEIAARLGRDPAEVARLLHEAQAASDLAAPGSFRPESLRGGPMMVATPEQRMATLHELSALLTALQTTRR